MRVNHICAASVPSMWPTAMRGEPMDQHVFGCLARLVTREADIWAAGAASAYAGERARG
jgi:hypothetical protein